MKILTVYIEDKCAEAIEELVRIKRFPNRYQAIQTAIKDFLSKELIQNN